MTHVIREITQLIEQAIRNAQSNSILPAFEVPTVPVIKPRNLSHGDYATPVAMGIAKSARLKPDVIAEAIVNHFPSTDTIGSVERSGGFVNFRLSDLWLQKQIDEILEAGSAYAQSDLYKGKRAQVECISANPTGPITVGRLRGGVMGDSLARLLRAIGYDVEMEYYFNNAGQQMHKLGESVRARYRDQLGLDSTFPGDGYQGDYITEIATQLRNERDDRLASEDWKPFKEYAEEKIFAMIKESLNRIGIHFDVFFNELTVYESGAVWDVLGALRDKNLVYDALSANRDTDYDERPDEEDLAAQGDTGQATWIRMREIRNTKKDKAVVKSSGEPTYRLPDTAYHINKFDRGFDLLVNILGADHIEEAQDVRAMLEVLGYDVAKLNVILHQFVTLTENNEVKRMSTRRGDFVTLDELMEDVHPDAIRYFMLARSPDSELVFDIDLARRQSNDNPVFYIQNAHVRCASILRVAEERGLDLNEGDLSLLSDERELNLIRKMSELPDMIELSVNELEPHRLAFWAHEELARTFHPTYEDIRVLHSTVPDDIAAARLKLYAAAKIVFKQVLELMGMTAPESM